MFQDRTSAGRALAGVLARRDYPDPIVLALPRGGVPVGAEVARRLACPLDLLLVRKLGVPRQPELAAAAVVMDGPRPVIVRNQDVIAFAGLTDADIDRLARIEIAEIERRHRAYIGKGPPLSVEGRTAILVDDGIATGASMKAAISCLRRNEPDRIVVAVPVAPQEAIRDLEGMADEVVCLETPSPFTAIGLHYLDFSQLADQEVIEALAGAAGAGKS